MAKTPKNHAVVTSIANIN
jgi:hypothetical protein